MTRTWYGPVGRARLRFHFGADGRMQDAPRAGVRAAAIGEDALAHAAAVEAAVGVEDLWAEGCDDSASAG